MRRIESGRQVAGRTKRVAAVAMLAACAASGRGVSQETGGRDAERLLTEPASVGEVGPGQARSAQVDGKRAFAIPAGNLSDALEVYRRLTGVAVTVKLGRGSADDFRTIELKGQYADDQALRLLLDGTGLTANFVGPQTATIGIEASDKVEVTAGLPDGVAMNKFTSPLVDTPATVNVVPRFVLDDEQVTTLKDTLRNVPGISLAAGEAGAQGDNLTIRGFTARNDIFLDGIRDFGSYYRDSFNYEQVEALEGPAGIAFGRGSTGGVINQESKIPQAAPHATVQAQLGSNLTRRLTADVNKPLAMLGGSAVRLNAMWTNGGVAGRPYDALRRWGVAPSITLGMNTSTRFTLSYLHVDENDTPDYGLPWFYNQLAPGVSRYAYFGFPESNYLKTNVDVITAKVDHTFNQHVSMHSIARAANYPRQAQITEPQLCSNAALSVPVGGYVTALPTSSVTGRTCLYTPGMANPSTLVVNRNQIQTKSVESDLWDQTEVNLHFNALHTRHEMVAGVEGGQEISNPIRSSYTIGGTNSVPSTSLVNPNPTQAFSGTGYITSVVHTKGESVGLYFVDTMHLGRLFELSGGVRWDRFDVGYNAYQPGSLPAGAAVTAASTLGTYSRVDAQPTYRAALVYKPNTKGSVYFDWGTSFNPSAESLALTSVTQNVAPEQNETYEFGVKQSLLRDRLMMEASIFNTTKVNARETDPTNSNNIVVAGNQRVRGIQVSAVGRLPQGMDLVAGYAYLDSAVTLSPFYPTSVGYQLANVPTQTFNAFVTHRLPWRFNGGFGGNYVASRTASSTTPFVPLTFGGAQTFRAGAAPCGTATTTTCYQVLSTGMKQVPGYWVFNAMLRRPITDHVEFQANVNNLLNRFFIDLPHPSHLVPGEGVNALMGVNYKF